jgi:hypothetical protein
LYISLRIAAWRGLKRAFGSDLSEMFGMSRPAPWKLSGRLLLKAIAGVPLSWPDRRARKPERKLPRCAVGWPDSMLFCVSKWLRERSSVPAKGTNAICLRCHSG